MNASTAFEMYAGLKLLQFSRSSLTIKGFLISIFILLFSANQASSGVPIIEYKIPTSKGNPQYITAGPDGNLWFTESDGNKIGKITTAGVITEYPLPSSSGPGAITAGPDGNLWFIESDGNKIGRITTSGAITEYALPASNIYPGGITTGPDGNLWFAAGNSIGKITTSGAITEYPLSNRAGGITAGPDGNVWFTEPSSYKIGKITPSGSITEYPLPASATYPINITAGPDGNLWFTETDSWISKIGKITTAGAITEYPLSSGSEPEGITAGPNGNLWFTESGVKTPNGNKIGMITTSGDITEYQIPTANSYSYGITTGPDGNLWFTEGYVEYGGWDGTYVYGGNSIAKVVLPPTNLTISPSSYDFGTVGFGGTSTPQTFTVTNIGTSNITISAKMGVYLSESNLTETGSFTLGTQNCSGTTLQPQGECTAAISFSPQGATGLKQSTLTVTDGNTNSVAATLTGTELPTITTPDLSGTLSITKTMSGSYYVVTAMLRIKNSGTADANNVLVTFYRSADNKYTSPSVEITSFIISRIAAGETFTKIITAQISNDPQGKYAIAVIDPIQAITESNESNNTVISNVIP